MDEIGVASRSFPMVLPAGMHFSRHLDFPMGALCARNWRREKAHFDSAEISASCPPMPNDVAICLFQGPGQDALRLGYRRDTGSLCAIGIKSVQ